MPRRPPPARPDLPRARRRGWAGALRGWAARTARRAASILDTDTGTDDGVATAGEGSAPSARSRPGGPPEHWLRLVAEHAPGYLHDLADRHELPTYDHTQEYARPEQPVAYPATEAYRPPAAQVAPSAQESGGRPAPATPSPVDGGPVGAGPVVPAPAAAQPRTVPSGFQPVRLAPEPVVTTAADEHARTPGPAGPSTTPTTTPATTPTSTPTSAAPFEAQPEPARPRRPIVHALLDRPQTSEPRQAAPRQAAARIRFAPEQPQPSASSPGQEQRRVGTAGPEWEPPAARPSPEPQPTQWPVERTNRPASPPVAAQPVASPDRWARTRSSEPEHPGTRTPKNGDKSPWPDISDGKTTTELWPELPDETALWTAAPRDTTRESFLNGEQGAWNASHS